MRKFDILVNEVTMNYGGIHNATNVSDVAASFGAGPTGASGQRIPSNLSVRRRKKRRKKKRINI